MPALTPGIIAIWSGAVVDIPAGWALCDGTLNTPNLLNRFIVGAGFTYNPGDTGGSTSHNHDLTTDGHFHTIPAGAEVLEGETHENITTTETDTATTDSKSHLPPYYALAYIMKL